MFTWSLEVGVVKDKSLSLWIWASDGKTVGVDTCLLGDNMWDIVLMGDKAMRVSRTGDRVSCVSSSKNWTWLVLSLKDKYVVLIGVVSTNGWVLVRTELDAVFVVVMGVVVS